MERKRMNEWVNICIRKAHKNFHTKACAFTAAPETEFQTTDIFCHTEKHTWFNNQQVQKEKALFFKQQQQQQQNKNRLTNVWWGFILF